MSAGERRFGGWFERARAMARREELRTLARRSREAILLAAATGALTGVGVALFERAVVDGLYDHLVELSPWVLAFMPLVGLLLAAPALRWVGRRSTPDTADAYLQAFHDARRPIRLREVPGKMLAAITTLGFGGAMGLEGPSLYLGSSIGTVLQTKFRRFVGRPDRRLLLVAGAAAGVSAIFKAPATGAVFALEVPYQDDLARRMLLPALVGSASSYLTFVAINGTAPILPVHGNPAFSFADLAGAVVLGILAGFGARAFAALVVWAKHFAAATPPLVRILAGGLSLVAIFAVTQVLAHEPITIGVGYNTIAWAQSESRAVWLVLVILVLRCLATAATVGGGGVGGLFIPLVVAGALLGRAVGGVVGDFDTSLFLVIGVAAFLGAGYRVPLAAVMFVAESTGRPGFVVPGVLAAVSAELIMGRASVTTYQQGNPATALVTPPEPPAAGPESPESG
ncbi:MAG TPA: chloride channel protein [Acidimicrobiia bacterium]